MGKGASVDRRNFVRLLLAGGASSLAGCTTRPGEKLLSEVDPPEELVPGRWLEYASVCRECPAGCGVLARTREARAIKLEGLPGHPINRGALCARGQAAVQGLYDPDRVRQPLRRNNSGTLEPIAWQEAEELLASELESLRAEERAHQLAVLSGQLGPSLRNLLLSFTDTFGAAGLWEYEPFAYEPLRAANRICFGRESMWRLRIEKARMILSLGADFLETWMSPVEQARGYSEARRYRAGEMGSHFQVEPRMSLTGANADDWLPTRPGSEYGLAMGLLNQILARGLDRGLSAEVREGLTNLSRPFTAERTAELTGVPADEIFYLAYTFASAQPSLALPVGISSSGRAATAAHIAVILLNIATGNLGETLEVVDAPGMTSLVTHAEMGTLIEQMVSDEVALLMVHQSNPSFTLPAASGWAAAVEQVPLVVAFSSTLDETAAEADLVLPIPTWLESWGDFEPRAGILGLQQPSMRPLHDTRHLGEILMNLAQTLGGEVAAALPWESFHDCLRDRWAGIWEGQPEAESFDSFWIQALRQGGLWEEVEAEPVSLDPSVFEGTWLPQLRPVSVETREDESREGGSPIFDLVVFPSSHLYDGRGANRSWLQEIPDPIAQVVWGPWAEIHPEAARRLGVSNGDLLALRSAEGEVRVPALLNRWIQRDVVAVPLGYGHTEYGHTARRPDGNPLKMLGWDVEEVSGGLLWQSEGVTLERLGPRQQLVSPRGGSQQQERGLAQVISLAALRRGAAGSEHVQEHELPPLYPPHEHPKHRWGMVIDNHACIGCNACAVACYAENNVAVVGREQMALGREASWLRIEVYDEGIMKPEVRFLPMLCMQCDNAPCEPVCPVVATYHTAEGLNAQVYNRCVGTRYCSHNCPYKVRRFNWFKPQFDEPLNLQLNPDVSVRDDGVMEKCTFCVQRIQAAKHRAQDEGRDLQDGDIVPACAQTCPTNAIQFGDSKDPDSEVSRAADDRRAYLVLEHLNTKPAVVYLKKISSGEVPE